MSCFDQMKYFSETNLTATTTQYFLSDMHSSHLQLPIWMICFYAIISTVLVVVPLITNPYDAAMGIVIVLVTGVPYYAIFVMKMLPMNAGAKYNRRLKTFDELPEFVD